MTKQYTLNIDPELLEQQKLQLAEIVLGKVTTFQPEHYDLFEGLLGLLEEISDQAAEQ